MKTVGLLSLASLALFAVGCASSPPIQPVGGGAGTPVRQGEPPPGAVGTEPTPIETTGSPVASRQIGAGASADDESTGDDSDGEQAGSAVAAPPPVATAVCEARVGARGIRRSALKRTLSSGLGNWLRGVEVEPRVERGQFRGWLVQRVYEGDPCWADVDLKAGDIVTRVNRRPIERPEQAHAVWSSLKDARDIVVDYERAGRSRTLRFDVVEDR